MSFSDWFNRAREWIVIVSSFLAICPLYIGGWAFIGWMLFQNAPWGLAAAVALFIADVVLLYFAVQWGLILFFCLFFGALGWYEWQEAQWWGVAVAALFGALASFLSIIRGRRVLMGYDVFISYSRSDGYDYSKHLLELIGRRELLRVLDDTGRFPKEAERRAANAPEHNPVDCTVFAPDRVERQQLALLQVFLHDPEDRKQAEEDAEKFDPNAKERGHKSLVLDAPVGTVFAFNVEVEGFVFPERTNTLLWTGQPQAATFGFKVPKGCKLGQHSGTVRISQDRLPVGRISFLIEVVRDASGALERPVGKEARHYHACFCSYSSLDRAEMLKRAQGIRAVGLETFIDVMTLRPGDIWNPKILASIEQSDLFVVIWSKNARDSKWVKKESRYALKLLEKRGSPDFVPIPVEGPPIASVPRGLKARHFNDELLSLIRAAEVEAEERERKKAEQAKPEA
jgi:hypothetical protein